MPTSTISYLWRDPGAARTFQTGVSLHSHTNQSQETLDFVADWGSQYKLVRPMLERLERRSTITTASHQLGPQLLDSAAHPQAGLRSREPADRKAGSSTRWFLSRITTIFRRRCCCAPCPRASYPHLRRVDRALRRRPVFKAVLPPRHSQPAQRPRFGVDGDSGRVHRQAQRCPPDRVAGRAQPGAECPGHLQPPALGSLPDRPGEA
jgi:hypothetical protein